MIEEKEFYSISEVASILSVSNPTVRSLMKDNKLDYINVGTGQRNVFRIKKESLNKFMNK